MSLALVLPLLFNLSDTTVPPKVVAEPSPLTLDLTYCTDEVSGKNGYCYSLRAKTGALILFVCRGHPYTLTLRYGVITHTIWPPEN
jgi:hypothetical protein